MPRPANTEERREQIVQGLLDVVAAEGLKGASTAAIARAAGLTPGLVHYHFKTKTQVLEAAVARLLQEHRARVARTCARAASPKARLEGWIEATAHRHRGDPRAVRCWVALAGESISDEAVREALASALDAMRADLLPLVEATRPDDAPHDQLALASAMIALVLGAFLLAATAPALAPAGFLAAQLHALVDDGHQAAGPGRGS